MFKLIMLVKKQDGLSDAEFRARWQAHPPPQDEAYSGRVMLQRLVSATAKLTV